MPRHTIIIYTAVAAALTVACGSGSKNNNTAATSTTAAAAASATAASADQQLRDFASGVSALQKKKGGSLGSEAASAVAALQQTAVATQAPTVVPTRTATQAVQPTVTPTRTPTLAPAATVVPSATVARTATQQRAPASGAKTPQTLYTALLTATFTSNELPPGFTVTKQTEGDLSSEDTAGQSAGGHTIDVTFKGTVPVELASMVVYTSAAEAQKAYAALTLSKPFDPGAITGASAQKCASGTFPSSGNNYPMTQCEAVVGNVTVYTIAISADSLSATVDDAGHLLTFTSRHIVRVQGS